MARHATGPVRNLVFASVVFACVLPWEAADVAYRHAFQAVANVTVARVHERSTGELCSFSDFARPDSGADTKILTSGGGTSAGRLRLLSVRRKSFLPFALLVALVVTSGAGPRSVLGRLAATALVHHAVMLVRLGVFLSGTGHGEAGASGSSLLVAVVYRSDTVSWMVTLSLWAASSWGDHWAGPPAEHEGGRREPASTSTGR